MTAHDLCMSCGAPLGQPERREVPYDVGLPYPILLEGVPVIPCSSCDEEEVEIRDVEALHRLIAHIVLAERRNREGGAFVPEEVRFLRKLLGWSNLDFAERMGVRPETSSRWQSGQPMNPTATRLLEQLVLSGDRLDDYRDELQALERDLSTAGGRVDRIGSGVRLRFPALTPPLTSAAP